MKIVSEIKRRWKSETPLFWVKVKRLGLGLSAIGALFLNAERVSEDLHSIGGYMALAGGVIAALSQLTVKDNDEQR